MTNALTNGWLTSSKELLEISCYRLFQLITKRTVRNCQHVAEVVTFILVVCQMKNCILSLRPLVCLVWHSLLYTFLLNHHKVLWSIIVFARHCWPLGLFIVYCLTQSLWHINEPPHGVLGSREKGGQNNQGARTQASWCIAPFENLLKKVKIFQKGHFHCRICRGS